MIKVFDYRKWIFINNNNRGNVLEFSEEPLKHIPIRLIDWTNKEEIKIYDKIINIVSNNLQNFKINDALILDNLVNSLLSIKRDF